MDTIDILKKQISLNSKIERNLKLIKTEQNKSSYIESDVFNDLRHTTNNIISCATLVGFSFFLGFLHAHLFFKVMDMTFAEYYQSYVLLTTIPIIFCLYLLFFLYDKYKKRKTTLSYFFTFTGTLAFFLTFGFVFTPGYLIFAIFKILYLSFSYKSNKYKFVRKHRCKNKTIQQLKNKNNLLNDEFESNFDLILKDNNALYTIINSKEDDIFYSLKDQMLNKIERNAVYNAFHNQVNENKKNKNLIINS